MSWAIVSLNIVANAETMSAFRWRIEKDGEAEVRSSEKHVSLFVWRSPEDEHVVRRCLVGWSGSVEPMSRAVRRTSKTSNHIIALVTSPTCGEVD